MFTLRVHEHVTHPSNGALLLLSPVHVHLTAQLCAVFTCVLVPSVGRTAEAPSCYDCTDPLGVIAETHTVLVPGAALCSIMVSFRFEEEPTAKRANIL